MHSSAQPPIESAWCLGSVSEPRPPVGCFPRVRPVARPPLTSTHSQISREPSNADFGCGVGAQQDSQRFFRGIGIEGIRRGLVGHSVSTWAVAVARDASIFWLIATSLLGTDDRALCRFGKPQAKGDLGMPALLHFETDMLR